MIWYGVNRRYGIWRIFIHICESNPCSTVIVMVIIILFYPARWYPAMTLSVYLYVSVAASAWLILADVEPWLMATEGGQVFLSPQSFLCVFCLKLWGRVVVSVATYRSRVVLCDTHDTSILIVDTYVTILVSPMSRYTAVYRSSTKYRETAQVSRVSSIPCSSYHLAFSNVYTTSL